MKKCCAEVRQEQGLRDLPTAVYPTKTGVTLKCVKTQEAVRANIIKFESYFEVLP